MRLACCLLLAAATVTAEEWVHPRGNLANTGVVKNKGPKKPPKVQWEREEKGAISTGAALGRGRLVYGVGEFLVACRSDRGGAMVWDAKVKQQVVSWPSVQGNFAYFGGQDTVFYRIIMDTGGEPACQESKAANVADPCIVDDYYLAGSLDGFFYAMGAKTGRLFWRGSTGPVRRGAAFAKGRVYVANTEGKLHCFDLKMGKELWTAETKAEPLAAPILGRGIVLLPLPDRVAVFQSKSGKPGTDLDTKGISSAPVLEKSLLHYGTGDGEIVTLDLKTGKEAARLKVADEGITTPLILARKILYAGAGAKLVAVDLKAKKILWTYEGKEKFLPPIAAGGALFVGSGNVFYCLR